MTGITDQLKKASKAKGNISTLAIEQKSELLRNIAIALENNISDIIIENSKDLDQMDPTDAKYDRLKLTEERIHGLAKSLRDVAELPDPTGIVLTEGILANGLKIEKKSVAIGVVAVI